jgi:hypothetical protein
MTIRTQKTWLAVVSLTAVILIVFSVSQFFMLRKAHSTFDNYYAFRGCTKLIDRTGTYGDCQLASGEIIKIVQFKDRWYLDGDLPWACLGSICFGL